MKTFYFVTCITFFLLLVGCEKESKILTKDYPYILQDDVSGIDATGVSVSARLIGSGEFSISDFGFVISTHAKPTLSDRRLSLKSVQSSPDNLTLRIDNDLVTNMQYFIRAYIQTDRYLVYSNEKSFTCKGCMLPRIDRLSLASGIPGNVVTITGDYFSEKKGNNIVYFGDLPALIIHECRDTIVVQCPNTTSTRTVVVSVEVAGKTGYASTQFNLVNPWTPLADFPGGSRYGSSYFTVGNKGYITLGVLVVKSYATTELWEFNSTSYQWQERSSFPAEQRDAAVAFTIGNAGFVGLGKYFSNATTYFKDLWEYNTQSDTWTKKADFPGTLQINYPHFVIDNKLYLYTPFNADEFWTYDPSSDIWTRLPSDPQLQKLMIYEGFTVGNTGYFIEISGAGAFSEGIKIWQFNPQQNTFFKADSLHTNSYNLESCTFNIGKHLFISAQNQELIDYDMDRKLLFYFNHPSPYQAFNFSFLFDRKAILNNIESPVVSEFNLDAALHHK